MFPLIVYFSSVSENTHRFVQKLDMEAMRIPISSGYITGGITNVTTVDQPFILITPTYGSGKLGGHVPKQVIHFLNDQANRSLLRGVISAGNSNFGVDFCKAGDIISAKCHVPYLYRFELMGTREDVHAVQSGLHSSYNHSSSDNEKLQNQ